MAYARPPARAAAGPALQYRPRRADPPLPFTRAFFDSVCAVYKQRLQQRAPYPTGEILLGLEASMELRPGIPGLPAHCTAPCPIARPGPEAPLYSEPPALEGPLAPPGPFDWAPARGPRRGPPCGLRPLARLREAHDLALLAFYHDSRQPALREASAAELQSRGWGLEESAGVWVLPQGPVAAGDLERLYARRAPDCGGPSPPPAAARAGSCRMGGDGPWTRGAWVASREPWDFPVLGAAGGGDAPGGGGEPPAPSGPGTPGAASQAPPADAGRRDGQGAAFVVEFVGHLERLEWLGSLLNSPSSQHASAQALAGPAGGAGRGVITAVGSGIGPGPEARPTPLRFSDTPTLPSRVAIQFRSAVYYSPVTRRIHVYASNGPIRLTIHAFASFCFEGGEVVV